MNRKIKTYEIFINEAVNNSITDVLSNIKDFISRKYKIENFDIRRGFLTIQFSNPEEYNAYFNDMTIKNEIKSKYDDPRRSITFNNYVSGRNKVEIMIKDLYTKKIKPPKFVYHVSNRANYKSIKKNGLIAGTNENEYGHFYGYDKPFVFATMYPNRLFLNNDDLDVWIINTTIIDNEWYLDFNYLGFEPNHIITDKNVPPNALKRVSMGEFDKRYRNLKS